MLRAGDHLAIHLTIFCVCLKTYTNLHRSYIGLRSWADRKDTDKPLHSRSLIIASLSAYRNMGYYRMYEWKAKALMILCACAGLSKSAHLDISRQFSLGAAQYCS